MLKSQMIQGILEAGCDEAGRGPLAGSVFAAAVVLPADFRCEMLNDSKQLTEKQRYALRPIIEEQAISWAVAEVTAEEIDRYNILQSSLLGMRRALEMVRQDMLQKGLDCFGHILVDGNKWKPYVPEGELLEVPADTVVHGDATYMSIAAASILAKTYRDDYMLRLHEEYPQYGWDENKGYPTAKHYAALKQFGPTPYHRMTFNLKTSEQEPQPAKSKKNKQGDATTDR